MIIRAAFATDDGTSFITRHFGDAELYMIYEIDDDGFHFVKEVRNTSAEEKEGVHADPEKARGIAAILKQEQVNTAVSMVFGPNIKRIRKQFVCVLLGDIPIAEAVAVIQVNNSAIQEEWLKGSERTHINLKKIS